MRERAEHLPFIGSIALERYRIEAELGAGAMGTVYRGRHVKVGRTVAIKVMHDHLLRDPAMVERFEREARIAAKLDHQNLVAVIDLGTTDDGKQLMVLEHAPGRPLADLVTAPQPRTRVIALMRQLLAGLDHAHRLGLVHRDLKPENVLVETTRDGLEVARIVDFGIAVLREPDDSGDGRRLTSEGLVLGTPMYMAPEQARGEAVDGRADLFALGVIVYELLAGAPPFCGEGLDVMMRNLTEDPPPIAERTGCVVDPGLEAFARTLMARERAARFQSAQQALDALDELDRQGAGHEDGVPEPIEPEPMQHLAAAMPHAPAVPRADAPVADRRDTLPTRPLTAFPPATTDERSPHAVTSPAATDSGARRRSIARLAVTWAIAVVLVLALVAAFAGRVGRFDGPDAPGAARAPAIEIAACADELAVDVVGIAHESPPIVTRERAEPATTAERIPAVTNAKRMVPVTTTERDRDVGAEHAADADGDVSSAVLAARYIAVGEALRGAPDELWQRYRRLRINEALASPDARRAALTALDEIDRALDGV